MLHVRIRTCIRMPVRMPRSVTPAHAIESTHASGGGGGGTCAAHIGICIGIDGGEGTSVAAGGGMLTAAVQRCDERVGGVGSGLAGRTGHCLSADISHADLAVDGRIAADSRLRG